LRKGLKNDFVFLVSVEFEWKCRTIEKEKGKEKEENERSYEMKGRWYDMK
jgi:hypothetical protein